MGHDLTKRNCNCKKHGFKSVFNGLFLLLFVFSNSEIAGQTFYPIGDGNCDNKINILDLNILVSRIFRGGPLPGDSCPEFIPFGFPYDGNDHVFPVDSTLADLPLIVTSHPGNTDSFTIVAQSSPGVDIVGSELILYPGNTVILSADSAVQYIGRPDDTDSACVATGFFVSTNVMMAADISRKCDNVLSSSIDRADNPHGPGGKVYTYKFTGKDKSGTNSSCDYQVIFNDNFDPTVDPKPLTINPGAGGTAAEERTFTVAQGTFVSIKIKCLGTANNPCLGTWSK